MSNIKYAKMVAKSYNIPVEKIVDIIGYPIRIGYSFSDPTGILIPKLEEFISVDIAEKLIARFPDLRLSIIISDTDIGKNISKNIKRLIIVNKSIFTSSDLAALCQCQNLHELYISGLYKNFRSLFALSELQVLYIERLPLNEEVMHTFRSFPDLIQLHLIETNIDDFKFLCKNPKLEVLDVSKSIVKSISSLPFNISLSVFICYDTIFSRYISHPDYYKRIYNRFAINTRNGPVEIRTNIKDISKMN